MKISLSISLRQYACRAVPFLIAATLIAGIAGRAKPGLSSGSHSSAELAEDEWHQAQQILHAPQEGPVPLYAEDHSAEAARLLRSAASRGHAKAAVHLGSLYLCGKGVEKSAGTALRLYNKAAGLFFRQSLLTPIAMILSIALAIYLPFKIGSLIRHAKTKALILGKATQNPRRLYKLALRYIHGKGTSKQLIEARILLEKAVEQNYAPAQVELGRFFRDGIHVQASRVKAAEWFLKAAEQGDKEGLFLAGSCYEQGAGVPLYLPKAFGFYLLASAQGQRTAEERIKLCDKKMTDAQKKSGQTFAANYAEENGFMWFYGSVQNSGKDSVISTDREDHQTSGESSARRGSRRPTLSVRRARPKRAA